jgi:putative peptide zinc metalloprotease protein
MAHPLLRDDLDLHESAANFDGSPQWVIHDSLRNRFFSIDWVTFEFLSRWEIREPQLIIEAINQQTTLNVDESDYEAIIQFLLTNELIMLDGNEGLQFLNQQVKLKKSSFWSWLVHNYLFFRIPLIQTDGWLEKNVSKVQFFYSPIFYKCTVAIAVIGFYLFYRHFDVFSATFLDMFSWQGFVAYFFAIIFVKIIHELAHAFTAKRMGCRVPTMGVAFLVMMPLAYTDTNDVWKLKDRGSRLYVDMAGMAAELIVAVWALFLWGITPPGVLKNIFYILATITWINTLLVNISPFMRFDGYYALSDFLKISNLHTRAFSVARWHFRKHLFGFDDPPPEHFPKNLQNFLIVFAWITGIYRLTVFLSIAFLVYHFFIKVVGIVLFLIEIIWFIALPIYSEIIVWLKRKAEINANPKRHRLLYVLFVILFIICFPLDFRVREAGILKPELRYYIYSPEASKLLSALPAHGRSIEEGQPITQLSSPELDKALVIAKQQEQLYSWKISSAAFDTDLRMNLQSNTELYFMAQQEVLSLEVAQAQLNPKAPFSGKYYELIPDLLEGDWMGKGAKLGVVVNARDWIVEAYFPEEEITRLSIGNWGSFFPETAGNRVQHLKLISIDPTPIKVLPDHIYASQMGGTVVAKIVDQKAITDRAYYRVLFSVVSNTDLKMTQRGHLIIFAKPESILSFGIRHFGSLFRRELSF